MYPISKAIESHYEVMYSLGHSFTLVSSVRVKMPIHFRLKPTLVESSLCNENYH